MKEIDHRDLSEEIRELDRAPKRGSPYDRRTRLGGRFPLIYPALVGTLLILAYWLLVGKSR